MRVQCPMCHGKGRIDGPHHMEAHELKATIGALGWKFGYGAPMPQAHAAQILGCSARSLSRYLSGERPIPPQLAHKARTIKEHPTFQVPVNWVSTAIKTRRRKEHFRQQWEAKQKNSGTED